MSRLDDATWWWEHALDGIVGGLVGGLVTALAVLLTLRHERRLAHEVATQEAAAGVQSACAANFRSLIARADGTAEYELDTKLLAAIMEFVGRLRRRWPSTAAEVTAGLQRYLDVEHLVEEPDESEDEFKRRRLDDAIAQLNGVAWIAAEWLPRPRKVESLLRKGKPISSEEPSAWR